MHTQSYPLFSKIPSPIHDLHALSAELIRDVTLLHINRLGRTTTHHASLTGQLVQEYSEAKAEYDLET